MQARLLLFLLPVQHHIFNNILHNQLLTAAADFIKIHIAVAVQQLVRQRIEADNLHIISALHVVRQQPVRQHQHALAKGQLLQLLGKAVACAASQRYAPKLDFLRHNLPAFPA